MTNTPDNSHNDEPSPTPDAESTTDPFFNAQPGRIERINRRRRSGQPRWALEMFEPTLMDDGIAYTVHDASPSECDSTARSWIEFIRPTESYRDRSGDQKVLVRLTVDDGRLSVTAPHVYPRNSLIRTTNPPPDRDGNRRVMRLGEEGLTQIDLMMAADGLVTASLRMETILRPFTRREIVQIAHLFVEGIDLLDFFVRQHGLLIAHRNNLDL
jgi:hypothetical protein